MTLLTTPNTFFDATTIQAAPFNSNFAAIQAAVNSIDNSNVGGAGFFASQIIPTSAAQATFAGTFGYTFNTGSTPLTVTNSTSTGKFQLGGSVSAATFDWGITAATALTFNVPAAASFSFSVNGSSVASLGSTGTFISGNLQAGASGGIGSGTVSIGTSAGSGLSQIGTTTNTIATIAGSGFYFQNNNGTGFAAVDGSGNLGIAGSLHAAASVFGVALQAGTSGTLGSGTLSFGTTAGTGLSQIESSSSTVQTIAGSSFLFFNSNGTTFAAIDGSGNLGIAGTLHQASTRKAKKNIADLSFSPLDLVASTAWKQYHLLGDNDEKQPHVGFVAEDSSEWLGGKEKCYVIASDLAGIAAAAVAELTRRLRVAGVAV